MTPRTLHVTAQMATRCLIAVAMLATTNQAAAQGTNGTNGSHGARSIRVGQAITDSLTAGDAMLDTDSSRYDLWSFSGKRGQRFAITMRSKAFDSYLAFGRLENDLLQVKQSNDDGGGGSDARMSVTLGADGAYGIRANSLRAGELGPYTLVIEQLPSVTPAAPKPIRLGQTATGALADTDGQLEDGSFYDEWTYDGKKGERIRVTMKSQGYSAYLNMGRTVADSFSSIRSGGSRGSGEDSTSARINVTLPADGRYVIRANSVAAEAAGGYSLLLIERPPAVVATKRPIRLGQTISASLESSDAQLDDDSYYDLWTYSGKKGDRLQITMRSQQFDTYLAVGRMQGDSLAVLKSDDDGADSTNSRVILTLPADGEYSIRTNSLSGEATGAYTLAVSAAPATVPAVPKAIRTGQTVSGALEESDPVMEDESHYDLWTFTGKRGDRVRITMRSSAFDTYLGVGRMVSGELDVSETDDDGGGDTDSRLDYTLPADGEYVIRANSLSENVTGAYTLSLEVGTAASSATATVSAIRVGQTVSGELNNSDSVLDDGSFYDLYSYRARAGEKVQITLRSGDFDAYFAIGQMKGGKFTAAESDDDSAGGTDAKIDFTFPADGDYLIRANTLAAGETGRYTLRIESIR